MSPYEGIESTNKPLTVIEHSLGVLTGTQIPSMRSPDTQAIPMPTDETNRPHDERQSSSAPTIRGATIDDIEALIGIELAAFQSVYGMSPDESKIDSIRERYTDRVLLLGDLIRVLETTEDGVYGMMVCCPTNLGREDFSAHQWDMTNSTTINQAYDSEGRNGYIVNLAIHPDKQATGGSAQLYMDAIQIAMARGTQKVYFESRLPKFEKWAHNRTGTLEGDVSWDELAEEYWQATEVKNGVERAVDPLLRMYIGIGAEPIKLIKDAWKPDSPSKGYGVLCEFTIPTAGRTADKATSPAHEPPESDVGSGTTDKIKISEDDPSFLRGLGLWIKKKKTALLLGSAVTGFAYSMATGAGNEIMERVRGNSPWVAPAYLASLAIYMTSAGALMAAAGSKLNFQKLWNLKEELRNVADGLTDSVAYHASYWINTVSALAASGVVAAGIVETLPPTAWGALGVPIVDTISTLAMRYVVHPKNLKH